jgi:hypothetical protein
VTMIFPPARRNELSARGGSECDRGPIRDSAHSPSIEHLAEFIQVAFERECAEYSAPAGPLEPFTRRELIESLCSSSERPS